MSVKGSKEIIKMFNFLKLNVTKDQCQKLVTDIFFPAKMYWREFRSSRSGVSSPESERPHLYYSAIRNDKYPPFASMWMELEGIMLSEVSQLEKDNHYMVSFIWGI